MRTVDADSMIDKYGDWYTEEGTEEGYIGTIKGIVDSMPTIEPEITGKKVLAWLLAYHAKSFDLRGHYKAHEVIGWLIHDISKDLLENDGGEKCGG